MKGEAAMDKAVSGRLFMFPDLRLPWPAYAEAILYVCAL
jgi:hypothetical protein